MRCSTCNGEGVVPSRRPNILQTCKSCAGGGWSSSEPTTIEVHQFERGSQGAVRVIGNTEGVVRIVTSVNAGSVGPVDTQRVALALVWGRVWRVRGRGIYLRECDEPGEMSC